VTLQEALEALVDEGVLTRWGVGRGALYTVSTGALSPLDLLLRVG